MLTWQDCRFIRPEKGQLFCITGYSSRRFSVQAYYGGSKLSQLLVDLVLQYSALCFCFNSQDGKKIREKEKEKKTK
jgi:hypothetical protein